MCRSPSSSSSLSHFLFPRDFSGTIADWDIINTPLDRHDPQMCLLGASLTLLPILGVKSPENPNFWGTNMHFQAKSGKILKVSCYRNSCIDFNHILHNDGDHQVVVVGGPNMCPTNPRWRQPPSWKKITKIAISPQRFDQSLQQNLVRWCKMGSLTAPTVKKFEFHKSKKLSYRRVTARCVLSAVILPITTQQCRNYLYDKSWPNRWYEVGDLVGGNAW